MTTDHAAYIFTLEDAGNGAFYVKNFLTQNYFAADATLKNYLTTSANWVIEGTRYKGLTKDGVSYSEAVKSVGQTTSLFVSWPVNLQNIFKGGCSSISQEVYTQKLGQAYRVATGHPEVGEEGEHAGGKQHNDHDAGKHGRTADDQGDLRAARHFLFVEFHFSSSLSSSSTGQWSLPMTSAKISAFSMRERRRSETMK